MKKLKPGHNTLFAKKLGLNSDCMKICFERIVASHNVKLKFLLVGVWNTVFGYSLFVLLNIFFSSIFKYGFSSYMSAMLTSQVISILNAFLFHKSLTFRSETKGKEMIFEFLRFCLTYVFTFFLSLILLPVFVEFLHLTPILAGAGVVLICTFISYFGHSRFSFNFNR
jgi:putative flippase GtrA